MGRSQRLRLQDVRAVFRLLGEVRELGDEPKVWQQHVAVQLSRLIGGKLGINVEAVISPQGKLAPHAATEMGWGDENERALFLHYMEDPEHDEDPVLVHQVRLLQRHSFSAWDRRQMVEDTEWYGSRHVNECRRAARVDGFLCSNVWIESSSPIIHMLAMHRAWGDRPFEAKQLRFVRLFHAELRRFWQKDPAARESALFGSLAPRLRQTLAGLLTGASEKEVARKLGLSRHTVHHYVTELYRHFQVSSRGELLTHCHRRARPTPLRPRLFMESQPDAHPLPPRDL